MIALSLSCLRNAKRDSALLVAVAKSGSVQSCLLLTESNMQVIVVHCSCM